MKLTKKFKRLYVNQYDFIINKEKLLVKCARVLHLQTYIRRTSPTQNYAWKKRNLMSWNASITQDRTKSKTSETVLRQLLLGPETL